MRQIAAEAQVSTGTAHTILKDDLGLLKKAPKFVPRILTEEQKCHCVQLCRENLKEAQDPLFLWTIMTRDESWFSVLEPEQKVSSLQWVGKKEKHPRKALCSCQVRKTMMEVFFDNQGVVHLEFLPPKMTVTAKVYMGILSRLREAIRRKRPVLWQNNQYRILHDNAPAHTATPTFAAMVETSMNVVNHPPYSPDLAPADFWFFPFLKSQIRGKVFANVLELQDVLMEIIHLIPKKDFADCITKQLPNRWRKCIAAGGEYFEGNNIVPPPDSELLDSSADSD